MNTIEIAGQTYSVTDCLCGGKAVHDATNADKVCTGGNTQINCGLCYRGTGKVYRLASPAQPEPIREPSEVGEIPDWML